MSDQIHQAPSAPAPPSEASRANFSRPTTANNAAPNTTTATTQHAPTTTDATPAAQSVYPAAAQTPATEEPQTINMLLNNADRYWKFKSALQTILIIVGLIGIGTLGWAMATISSLGFFFSFDTTWGLWPALLTFSCSVIWCAVCIVVFQFRKRPVHPGLRVAIDLLLWLAFICTAMFALFVYSDLANWGDFGDIDYGISSSYGDYRLLSNNTWVWQQDSDYPSYIRNCDRNSTTRSSSSYYNNMFTDCAQQDAFINSLWSQKSHRQSVELTGVVCQFLSLILHFALFIWACVDCHHHNRSKVSKDAEKLAANIVQTMITNGAIIPPPGQAHMRQWG